MEKIKKRIANLKVAGKLKVYRITVLVMTLFLVLVALISTLVIRSNIEKITEVWSPALEYLQDLETMTAKYRIKQYQHLVESDAAVMNSCEEEIKKLESQIQDTDAKLDAIMSADSAKSAVNTRDLIDKTLVEIEKGNNITRTTAEAFNQIIADMESFAELAQNTMEKANSQAESLEQIGQGIEQLSGVVQGNAASSEENTAISINLAEGASKMHDRVNIFKLF